MSNFRGCDIMGCDIAGLGKNENGMKWCPKSTLRN
jgi:hypothetical protein